MRKWIVVALALALGLAVVPLAAAGNGGGGDKGKGKAKFCLVGTVASEQNADSSTLTVKVKAGTRSARGETKSVKKWRGRTMTVKIDATKTKIRLVTADGCSTVLLADIPLNAKVKVRGTITDSVFTATFVKARVPAPTP